MTVQLTPEQHEQLQELARAEYRPKAGLARIAIIEMLAQRKRDAVDGHTATSSRQSVGA